MTRNTQPEPADVTYPQHFTANDIALIKRIEQWMLDRKHTQSALARLSRISAGSMNQILKGVYPTSPTKLLMAVESAMRNADESSGDAVAPVETSVFNLAQTSCRMARRYRNFAVMTGFVGTGKTFALKHYAFNHSNTHFIEATPTMNANSLLKLLARVIAGYDGKGNSSDRFDVVVDALKNTDSLIIIDEAETLNAKQLHILRRIRDQANIGIVLAGTEHLAGLIKPEHGQFDQIRSRTGFWPETVRKVTVDDAAALIQSSFGTEAVPDDVIDRLYEYSQGSARMLVEGLIASLKAFRKDNPLSVQLVDAVAKQALCLQPIK